MSLGAGLGAKHSEWGRGRWAVAVERGREQIERWRVEKTKRVKEGVDGRHRMHGWKERMREGKGFLDPNL